MGASEDRATLRDHERQQRASEIEEMMVPGYGIWTVSGVKQLLEEREQRRLKQEWASRERRREWRERKAEGPRRTQEQIASDMEMDRQAARDGYNPNR